MNFLGKLHACGGTANDENTAFFKTLSPETLDNIVRFPGATTCE
jgi:hypothetical protein